MVAIPVSIAHVVTIYSLDIIINTTNTVICHYYNYNRFLLLCHYYYYQLFIYLLNFYWTFNFLKCIF